MPVREGSPGIDVNPQSMRRNRRQLRPISGCRKIVSASLETLNESREFIGTGMEMSRPGERVVGIELRRETLPRKRDDAGPPEKSDARGTSTRQPEESIKQRNKHRGSRK